MKFTPLHNQSILLIYINCLLVENMHHLKSLKSFRRLLFIGRLLFLCLSASGICPFQSMKRTEKLNRVSTLPKTTDRINFQQSI